LVDYVTAAKRIVGNEEGRGSFYDQIGQYDMTSEDIYYERGINLRHGYLIELFVDDPEYLVKIPKGLKDVAVLLEPTSIIEKGIIQAYEAQRRFKVWRPKKAAVLGVGTVGLLAALSLKMKGFDVTSFGKEGRPSRNLDLLEELGVRYISTNDLSIREAAIRFDPFDLMFEATGYSPVVFEAMECLGKNGVLVLASVTGGDREHSVPAGKINLDFVLGNKLVVGTVNANSEYFERAAARSGSCRREKHIALARRAARDYAKALRRWKRWVGIARSTRLGPGS